MRVSCLKVCLLVLLAGGFASAQAVEKPAAGEERLDQNAAQDVLKKLKETFAAQGSLRAHILTETFSDLTNKTTKKEGDLLIQRPDKMLQLYTKPAASLQMLDGAQAMRQEAGEKSLLVGDFTKAPKKLSQVHAMVTGDLTTLTELFEISVFRAAAAEGKPAQYRIVLNLLPKKKLEFTRIQIRVADGEACFQEVVRETADGNTVTDKFSAVQVGEIPAKEFSAPIEGKEKDVKEISDEAPK